MDTINNSYITIKDFTKDTYQTKMLFRCTSLLYAKKFLETGNIRFGLPQEWIDEYRINGDGRGDLLEGCYCCMTDFNLTAAKYYQSLRQNVETFRDKRNNYLYFRSKDVLNMRTFCLFGLDKKDFQRSTLIAEKEEFPTCIVPKKYFEDFSRISKDVYDKLSPEEKPVLLMIHSPKKFHERLRKFMRSWGINDNEWLIKPVSYFEKNAHFVMGSNVPSELFLKDSSFEYQKEVRAVIFTKRQAVLNKMERCNGIIDIGCMKDIASIQEYYFDDMVMKLIGNNRMIYTLPHPIEIPLEEMDSETLMAIVQQVYENRLPSGVLGDGLEREEIIRAVLGILDKKFDIEFSYSDDTFRKRGTNQNIKIILQ